MRKLLLAAVAVAGVSGSAAAVDPGVYYCVTERMVGIQPTRDAKESESLYDVPRFAGLIKPDKEKFIVKIRRIDETERKSQCKFLWELKAEGEYMNWSMPDVLYCGSDAIPWEAVLPREKVLPGMLTRGGTLVSSSGEVFTAGGWAGTLASFNITLTDKNIVYTFTTLNRGNSGFGNYIEEGHCEAFEE